MTVPLVQEISYQDPCSLFSHWHDREGALFLDSAELRAHCGRYSFIAISPFQVLSAKNGLVKKNGVIVQANPFEVLKQELQQYALETLPSLPPFQGGVAGYWGYELVQHLEDVPLARVDDMDFPDLLLGFYDVVLAFDPVARRAWIFSSGFPAREEGERQQRALERLTEMRRQIEVLSAKNVSQARHGAEEMTSAIVSNFTSEEYQSLVRKTIDYILAGDIFEANISQRFKLKMPDKVSPFVLYSRLRQINPAPFAAYFHYSDTVLASASPERFLKLCAREVEARPIKGTCPRGKTVAEDKHLGQALLSSEKDRSENIMIVDLLRNDLSRVCENHSVQVPILCGLESYATVHHLVSVVTGRLRDNITAVDLLEASFPGGSVTGAPKCRAMEIIAELEPTQRGPYCGSMGYLGFDGNMDTSITIRTFCMKNQMMTFQAGGAVVADSCPRQEYEEVLTKARALFKALKNDSDY